MRRLAQPEVLKTSAIAALLTALACYPRLLLWTDRKAPVWYLEAVLFLGCIVLWAFVFAWHTEYTRRPVFTLKLSPKIFLLATIAGIATAAGLHFFLDPILRQRTPMDYPANLDQWIAHTLFGLAFLQLFLTFAPFAWLMRLFKDQRIAFALTLLLGVLVLTIKSTSSPQPVPFGLFCALFAGRIVLGAFPIWLYLRGGLVLSWWWGLLIHARLLIDLMNAG